MAQVQQDNPDVDPITQSFIVDRQAFWGRFTSFTTGAAIAVAALLIGLWLFVA
jgi:hypothetical protein